MGISLQKQYGFENPFRRDPLVVKAARFCKGKKVLDLGCGEGADAVSFARRGFSVTAVDNNPDYLKRLRTYVRDRGIAGISIIRRDALAYHYPPDTYDVVSSILVICCMRRSEFEQILPRIKRSVKPGGIIIMSARNYLDPELKGYRKTAKTVEPNTYRNKEYCCKFTYFVEKGRLLEAFHDFDVLWHYEGYAPCKYNEHPKHGDTYIICRRPRQENGSGLN